MTRPRLLVGLDVGTSALKALLVTERGEVLARDSQPYPLYTPRPGWTEQDPEDWGRAALRALARLAADERFRADGVAAIGLSGQMHGTVFLDRYDHVIRRALLWNDQRTERQCREIEEALGGVRALVEATGNLALTGFSAPKILWLRDEEPHAYQRLRAVLLPKDHVRFRLTGEKAAEVTDASGTLLFDVAGRRWSERMLSALGIDRALLPEVHESPAVVGRLTRAVAEATGFREGTPVVAGAGDQAAGAVGTGNVAPGTLTVAIGTSGVVFATGDRYLAEPEGRLHAFCHAAPGLWHTMGVMLSAGGSLEWLREVLSGEGHMAGFPELMRVAREVPPGAEGLVFHPYLTGERTPLNDPQARGAFLGLTRRHSRGHLVRAVLEGVVYGLLDCHSLMEEIRADVRRVILTGGASRDELWCLLVASALAREVGIPQVDEGPAFGAALLAGVGGGVFGNVNEACRAAVRIARTVEPIPEWTAVYRDGLMRYREMYRAVRGFYRRVG